MSSSLYDTLLDAKVSPEKARKAAEDVASYEKALADARTDLTVLKWMAGANTGFILLVLGVVIKGFH